MSYTTPPAIIYGEVELEVEMCSKSIECHSIMLYSAQSVEVICTSSSMLCRQKIGGIGKA